MPHIIPNWHPLFIHFTIALFTTSVVFHLFSYGAMRITSLSPRWAIEFGSVARWCLWMAALITVITVTAGFYAFSTVNHDAVSHAVMKIHRNLAFLTSTAIWLITLWSIWRYAKQKAITVIFIVALLIVQALVLSTAWYGAELVYRYGLGVLSLPASETPGHQHNHATMTEKLLAEPNSTSLTSDEGAPHQHDE